MKKSVFLRAAALTAFAVFTVLPAAAFRLPLPGTSRYNTSSRTFFPVGIYGVNSPDSIAIIKNAGFNTIQTYSTNPDQIAALARACRKNNLKLVAAPYQVMRSNYSSEARKRWPVLAWYLHDEPEVTGMPPQELFSKYMEVKNWSPEQLSTFVISEGKAAVYYGKSGDTLMADWYPVPHLPLESAGLQTDTALKGLEVIGQRQKPVWAVLQAFNWKYYPQRKKKRIGRYPTAYELRFMTYHAILSGAKGLFYFTYTNRESGLPLTEYPQLWHDLLLTVTEINALRPVLETGRETAVLPNTGGIAAKSWLYDGRTYLIAANTVNADTPVPAELLNTKKWTVLFERSSKITDLVAERKKPCFSPYRVFVLRSR